MHVWIEERKAIRQADAEKRDREGRKKQRRRASGTVAFLLLIRNMKKSVTKRERGERQSTKRGNVPFMTFSDLNLATAHISTRSI